MPIEACPRYKEHAFKKDICRVCLRPKAQHKNVDTPSASTSVVSTTAAATNGKSKDVKVTAPLTSSKETAASDRKTDVKLSLDNVSRLKAQNGKTEISQGATKSDDSSNMSKLSLNGNKKEESRKLNVTYRSAFLPRSQTPAKSVSTLTSSVAKSGTSSLTTTTTATSTKPAAFDRDRRSLANDPAAVKASHERVKSPPRPVAPPPEAPVPVFRKVDSPSDNKSLLKNAKDTSGSTSRSQKTAATTYETSLLGKNRQTTVTAMTAGTSLFSKMSKSSTTPVTSILSKNVKTTTAVTPSSHSRILKSTSSSTTDTPSLLSSLSKNKSTASVITTATSTVSSLGKIQKSTALTTASTSSMSSIKKDIKPTTTTTSSVSSAKRDIKSITSVIKTTPTTTTSSSGLLSRDLKKTTVTTSGTNKPAETSHYYHKYDISVKGKADCKPSTETKPLTAAEVHKKMLLEKLKSKIVAGENINEISSDSIALPYTVVDVSKFPLNTSCAMAGNAPPKLPNTPAPPQTSSLASTVVKTSTTPVKTTHYSARNTSEAQPDDKTKVSAKYTKPLPKTDATCSPVNVPTTLSTVSTSHKPEHKTTCKSPKLPIVLQKEADKLKGGDKSTVSPRKVPILIQSQESSSKDAYEPVNIKDFDFAFADEAKSPCKEASESSKGLSDTAKASEEAKKAFLNNNETIETAKGQKTDGIEAGNTSPEMQSPAPQASDKTQDKPKKSGKGFFKKLLRIGSKGSGDNAERKEEDDQGPVSPSKSETSSTGEVSVSGDAKSILSETIAESPTTAQAEASSEEIYENTEIVETKGAKQTGRSFFSPFKSSMTKEKQISVQSPEKLPKKEDEKVKSASSLDSVDKKSISSPITSTRSSIEESASKMVAWCQSSPIVETGTGTMRSKSRSAAVKKPGVPPPAAPPPAVEPSIMPAVGLTKSPQIIIKSKETFHSSKTKSPQIGIKSPEVIQDFQNSHKETSIIGSDFQSEILGLLSEISSTTLPPLDDEFRKESGMMMDEGSMSPALSPNKTDSDTDAERRRGKKCARSDSRNSKLLRSKMGAPPPPPPVDGVKRHSASDLTTHSPSPMTSSVHVMSSCGSMGLSGPYDKSRGAVGSTEKGSSLPRDLAFQTTFETRGQSLPPSHVVRGAAWEPLQGSSSGSLDAPNDGYDVGRLIENRSSSKFMNRALPLPPLTSADLDSENVYESVPSDSGKYSCVGTPLSDSRTCYEDIDTGDIYDDPEDITVSLSNNANANTLKVSGPLSPGGYLEPVSAAMQYELYKDKGLDSRDARFPDIIPTGSSSTLPVIGRTPPMFQSQISEPALTSTRATQDHFMPYVNMEMAMEPGRPALNFTEGLTKMSAINAQTMHIIIEEAFTSYLCLDAQFRNDLMWKDFTLNPSKMEFTAGDYGFYKANSPKIFKGKDCYLMISSKSIPRSLLDLCYINVVNPCAMFSDRISKDLLPEVQGKTTSKSRQFSSTELTNIAVLPFKKIIGLKEYLRQSHGKGYGSAVHESDRTVCCLMAQLLNALLFLHEKEVHINELKVEDVLIITTEHGELYPVVNPAATLNTSSLSHESQLFDSVVDMLFLLLKIRKKSWESFTQAITKRSPYSDAFRTLVSMLHEKQYTHQSMVTVRNMLEFMLWGPDENELKTLSENKSPQDGYSVWLEVSRCQLINEIALSRAYVSLEQANQMQFLCCMSGKTLVDVVKILNG